jgi:hypothetical protein
VFGFFGAFYNLSHQIFGVKMNFITLNFFSLTSMDGFLEKNLNEVNSQQNIIIVDLHQ